MGPKLNATDAKTRKQELIGMKKLLSKEIVEDTWTAGDQAYHELWKNEKIAQISKLQAFLDRLTLENSLLKASLEEKENTYRNKIRELRNKVNDKCEEIVRLTGENHRLIEDRKSNGISSAEQKEAEEAKFNEAQEKLGSEIKLLNGKLNDLEEFRIQRPALIEQNQKKLMNLKKMEERANTIVDVYQRIGSVNKVRMAQELKERLLKLSMEFQEASQTETTRNLIRENIAINNELGGHIGSWQALHDENTRLKKHRHFLKEELQSEETLKEKCLSLSVLQTQVIERLVHEHKKLVPFHQEFSTLKTVIRTNEEKLVLVEEEERSSRAKASLLLQQMHCFMTELNDLEQRNRFLGNTNFINGINLKRALLYVAEGQDLRLRRARGRLSSEELFVKLTDVLRTIEELFLTATPDAVDSIQDIGELVSTATIYDPLYGEKYWERLGVICEGSERPPKLEEAVKDEEDDGSSDSSEDS